MTISDLLKTKAANGDLSANRVVEDRSIKVNRINDIKEQRGTEAEQERCESYVAQGIKVMSFDVHAHFPSL